MAFGSNSSKRHLNVSYPILCFTGGIPENPCDDEENLYCLKCTSVANEAACVAANVYEKCTQSDVRTQLYC